MTTVLIDADLVAYRCAASCQKQGVVVDPVEAAIQRAHDLVQSIIDETEATSYRCFLTGSNNFRYQFNPDYKANRKNVPRPQWLQPVREYLVTDWNASVEDGQEADDAMGIYQCNNENTIIASLDKDMHMIPGEHYNWVKKEFYDISSNAAIHHLYWQLLMGDRSDNIFGFDGIARVTVPNKLQGIFEELASYDNELDMYNFVDSLYDSTERLVMNGICLWIRRNPDEIWSPPV